MVKSDFDTLEEVPSKKVNMFVLTEHLSGGARIHKLHHGFVEKKSSGMVKSP